MSEELVKNSVRSYSFGVPGKSLNQARTNHWVIDGSSHAETVSTVESFLAGVSACGVTMLEGIAATEGLGLQGLEVTIEGVRPADAPNSFKEVNMGFTFKGLSQADAERLVDIYQHR